MEGMIGEVRMFAGNFAPKNWAYCQGQILQISQNTALFSILGTTYGGNGTTNYALPDMQGRVCVGTGNGPGLSPYALGQKSGTETVTLTMTQMPAHSHVATGSFTPWVNAAAPDETNPSGGFLAVSTGGDIYSGNSNATMAPSPITATIGNSGSNQPHENMQPFLGMNYVICMYGIFPSRN